MHTGGGDAQGYIRPGDRQSADHAIYVPRSVTRKAYTFDRFPAGNLSAIERTAIAARIGDTDRNFPIEAKTSENDPGEDISLARD